MEERKDRVKQWCCGPSVLCGRINGTRLMGRNTDVKRSWEDSKNALKTDEHSANQAEQRLNEVSDETHSINRDVTSRNKQQATPIFGKMTTCQV